MHLISPPQPESITEYSPAARAVMGQRIQSVLVVRRTIALKFAGHTTLILRGGFSSMMWRLIEPRPDGVLSDPLDFSFPARRNRRSIDTAYSAIWERVAGHQLLDVVWQSSCLFVYIKRFRTISFIGPFYRDLGSQPWSFEDFSFNR